MLGYISFIYNTRNLIHSVSGFLSFILFIKYIHIVALTLSIEENSEIVLNIDSIIRISYINERWLLSVNITRAFHQ